MSAILKIWLGDQFDGNRGFDQGINLNSWYWESFDENTHLWIQCQSSHQDHLNSTEVRILFSPSGVLYVKARRGGETTSCGSAHHRKATSVWHTVCLSSCSKSSQSHHCKSGEVKCPSWIVHCWFGNIENRLAIPLCTPIQASLKHRLNQEINPPWLLVKEW